MPNPVSPSEGIQCAIDKLHHTTPVVYSEDRINVIKSWMNIKASVFGNDEAPDCLTKTVQIHAPDVPIGSHVCRDGSKNIKRQLKLLFPRFKKVFNITDGQMKIKHGLHLGECLLYDRKVVANPLEFQTVWLPQIGKFTFDNNKEQGRFHISPVKVVNYP